MLKVKKPPVKYNQLSITTKKLRSGKEIIATKGKPSKKLSNLKRKQKRLHLKKKLQLEKVKIKKL